MDSKQLAELLEKYLDGTATPEERALLERLDNKLLERELRDGGHPDYEGVKEAIYARLTTPKPLFRRLLPYAAAVAVLALAVSTWLLFGDRWSVVSDRQLAATEILPGGNRATLTLADGRVINLDEAQTGIVIGTEDITYDDGVSAVVMLSVNEPLRWGQEQGAAGPIKPSVNMLSLNTPKGGTYQVTLPDGSKVWLNSASTLKYPSRFSGDSREVILEGEAFFDIVSMDRARNAIARERSGSGTRDTRAPAEIGARASSETIAGARVSRVPFKVRTSGQTVNVLGTQFNISAYTDEAETKTTLVEGSVQVTVSPLEGGSDGLSGGRARPDLSGGVIKELKPGSQSITRARLPGQGAQIEIRAVDTEPYTSWKDGVYVLDNGDLHQLIRQLERWYDVEFVIDENIQKPVSGIIPRNANLSEVLRAIADNTGLKFTFSDSPTGEQGRRIMVAE